MLRSEVASSELGLEFLGGLTKNFWFSSVGGFLVPSRWWFGLVEVWGRRWRGLGELGVAGFAKEGEALVFSHAQGSSLWFLLAQVW